MDYILEGLLIALQFPILVGFIYWTAVLQNAVGRGERKRLKFKDLGRMIKSLDVLVMCYLAFIVYLGIANVLTFTGIGTLPFGGISSLALTWMLVTGLVGLWYLLSSTYPRVALNR